MAEVLVLGPDDQDGPLDPGVGQGRQAVVDEPVPAGPAARMRVPRPRARTTAVRVWPAASVMSVIASVMWILFSCSS